jgi:hypothetical protein
VHHVGAEIAGPGDAQDGVHVGPVEIDQRPGVVDHPGDLGDPALEDPQGVGVGDHEHGHPVVELSGQILQIDRAAGLASDVDRLESGHHGAGRIGAVGLVGDQHDAARLAPVAEVGRRHQ